MNIGKINFVDTDIKFRQIQQSKNITQVKHEKKDDKNRNNNINFTSRSATIRFADDIARKVNQEFPRISSSKIDDFKSFKKHKDIYVNFEKLLWKKVNSARKETMKIFLMTDDFLGKIQAIIKPVKHLKIGNCGESSLLSAIIAKTNGIKNCYPATIKSPYGDSFDHAVLYVADEKPYIIDAWLGFADYLPEAIPRYTKDFHDNFDFEKFETEKMIFCPADYLYCFNFFEHNFTKSNISQIIQKYPNFLIKKNQ